MQFFASVKEFLDALDAKYLKIVLGVFFGLFLALSLGLIYRYYSSISFYQKQLVGLNRKRQEAKQLLERFERVNKQQEEVNALLEADPNFKIVQQFEKLVAKEGLERFKTREPETSSDVLENGYTEVKLVGYFSNITMQQLTNLLLAIELNERIYTKELDIFRPPTANKTINVNLTIATLEAKQSESTAAE